MRRLITATVGILIALPFLANAQQPAPMVPAKPLPMPQPPVVKSAPPVVGCENPVYVPLGPNSYGTVFEKVFDVVTEYFEIAYANRYDGRIETFPKVAPGIGQPWKPGNPDWYGRILATLQSIRHRAFVLIQLADDGGYFVQVVVFREEEDLPKPIQVTAGAAAFRSANTVERQFEVIDPAVYDPHWIPIGRDTCIEQAIIEKIKKCL